MGTKHRITQSHLGTFSNSRVESSAVQKQRGNGEQVSEERDGGNVRKAKKKW